MKWEYLVKNLDIFRPDREVQNDLNSTGADEWELVSMAWFDSDEATVIFKRPLAEKKERNDT